MKVFHTIAEMRAALDAARADGKTIGLVATMGAFHEGHLSLMRRSAAECGVTVVTLFVNPTQFNDPRDLEKYPRDVHRDSAMAAAAGVDILFTPDAREMYPDGYSTTVTVSGISAPLEGASRGASHFAGVATVVTKLLDIVEPTVAYFGQKDAQQALVVKRLVRDLDLRARIEVCPTVREPDGLAMSSRNARLSAADRPRALALRAGLDAAVAAIRGGERRAKAVEAAGRAAMTAKGVAEVEYFTAVPAETLVPTELLRGATLLAVAAVVGGVRLIDNELMDVE